MERVFRGYAKNVWPTPAGDAHRRGTASRNAQDGMIALAGGIFERRRNVSGLEKWIVLEDFFAARPGGQQIENVLHANTQPANARPSSTLGRIGGYAVHLAHGHCLEISNWLHPSTVPGPLHDRAPRDPCPPLPWPHPGLLLACPRAKSRSRRQACPRSQA